MFHSSTTLWHEHRNKDLMFREHRLVYGEVWDKFAGFMGRSWGKVQRGWEVGKFLTWPIRAPMMPFWWALGKGWEGVKWSIEKTRLGVYTAFEGGKAVAVDTVGKPVWRLLKAPIEDVKRNLVDNTRIIMKNTLSWGVRMPYNIARTPWALLKSMGQSAKSVVTGGVEVAKSFASFSPRTIAAATRSAVGNVIAPPALREIATAYAETPIRTTREVLGNIVDSKLGYAYAMRDSWGDFKQGIDNVLHSPERGQARADDYLQRAIAKREAKAEEAAEKAKKGAAEAAAGHAATSRTPARTPAAHAPAHAPAGRSSHGGGGGGHAPAPAHH